MSKIVEQAVEDLQFEIQRQDNGLADSFSHAEIVRNMRAKGWDTLTVRNLVETARSIGFTVIGKMLED